MIRKGILVVTFMALTLTLIGCGKGKARYGEAMPGNVEVVKLKEMAEKPEEYKDKEVVLKGNYGNYCCASDFVFKEGFEAIEVYPKGFPTPKLDRGKPISVYGIVRVVAKGIKSEEGEADEGKKEERYPEIFIEAKGMEIK